MGARIPDINTHLPEIQELAGTLVKATGNGSVPATTISLVYLRAGQIVGSTYQVMRHSADLRTAGESEARIAAVATWWDVPYFTDAERAALALTDAVFRPGARGEERVPDDLYIEVAKHYEDKAMATLMMVLASAGFWMNIALIHKPTPVPA
ncbi:carboxymuconolactone decarboxylase family protein [Nonomuraea sp. NPDC048916]|uniref:carboxymuconolactone decarboxylase family protein n=1 Tax=Nonomuraea sp. NPDC048916 TaxID=3154232 RepID=UPI00340875AE